MEYFKLSEFKCKCCGKIPTSAQYQVQKLVNSLLDPVRRVLQAPIYVNSGYRCKRHNKAVGGVINSQHLTGNAADIRCYDNAALVEIIKQIGDFDQLIVYKTFIHVSYKSEQDNRHVIIRND